MGPLIALYDALGEGIDVQVKDSTVMVTTSDDKLSAVVTVHDREGITGLAIFAVAHDLTEDDDDQRFSIFIGRDDLDGSVHVAHGDGPSICINDNGENT